MTVIDVNFGLHLLLRIMQQQGILQLVIESRDAPSLCYDELDTLLQSYMLIPCYSTFLHLCSPHASFMIELTGGLCRAYSAIPGFL
jgi:hypothetical protein